MGKSERQAYFKAIRSRYRRAGKKAKITILDEFCAVCRYHRKYAIRLLNQQGRAKAKRSPGRKSIYATTEFLTALKRIWFASDQMCSKKLKAAIDNSGAFHVWRLRNESFVQPCQRIAL